jgi:hypothetical protein
MLKKQCHIFIIEGSVIQYDNPAAAQAAVEGFDSQKIHENITVPQRTDNYRTMAIGFQWRGIQNIPNLHAKAHLVAFFLNLFEHNSPLPQYLKCHKVFTNIDYSKVSIFRDGCRVSHNKTRQEKDRMNQYRITASSVQ